MKASLLPHDHTTVKTLHDHLREVVPAARELAQQIGAINEIWNRVLGALGVSPRSLAARDVGMVQDTLGLIGKVSLLRRSWLDTERRQAIREVLDKTRSELPEFSENAALRLAADPDCTASLSRLIESRASGLQSGGIATVVQLRNRLEAVARSVQTVGRCHAETQSCAVRCSCGGSG